MNVEEFVAQRRTGQEAAAAEIRPAVEQSLAQYEEDAAPESWVGPAVAAALAVYVATHEAEAPGIPVPGVSLDSFQASITQALDLTTPVEEPERSAQADRLAMWLAVAAINAATYDAMTSADRGTWAAQWLTMRDTSVRRLHRPMDGQRRSFGQTFEIAGYELRYPGEPVGPPEIWINCRCVLRRVAMEMPDTLVAAPRTPSEHEDTWGMVALAPANPEQLAVEGGDPAEELHITLFFLGDDVTVMNPAAVEAVQLGAARAAKSVPDVVSVAGVGMLGDSEPKATVLFLNGAIISNAREALTAEMWDYGSEEFPPQFEPFIPHMTLGYGLDPNDFEHLVGQEILLDRVDVHLGGNVTTHTNDSAIVAAGAMDVAEEDLTPLPDEAAPVERVPWHGVLAPEGVWSGDRRRFAPESLRWRDLPLPLMFQRAKSEGHDGATIVGQITEIVRDAFGLMRARGYFNSTPEAEEAIALLGDGDMRGVSVDVDDHDFELNTDTGELDMLTARICGATLCAIPAFAEAFIALGDWEDETIAAMEGQFSETVVEMAISEGAWDGSSSRYTDEQWFQATLIHTNGDSRVKSDNKLPILEPNGDLSRAGVHAAASRLNQVDATPEQIASAKGALRGAYRKLGEEPPEVIAAAGGTMEFKRGPGWVTHPEETRRLHTYWTRGPGAAKIRWGTPGDFNRCRTQLAKYLPPNFLNRTCAEWHHDATGSWPGPGREHAVADAGAFTVGAMPAPPRPVLPPLEFFANPGLTEPTHPTLTEDGHYFGHIAVWDSCHLDYREICVTPPTSPSDYAYFATGVLETQGGFVPVGQITFDAEHADEKLTPALAQAHYANTATAVADVFVGEDEVGIWFSGVLRPEVDDELVARIMKHRLSGDWRRIRGNFELVAALAVNMPAYPMRAKVAFAGAQQMSLIGAGMLSARPADMLPPGTDLDALAEALERRQERRARAAAVRAKMNEMSAADVAAVME